MAGRPAATLTHRRVVLTLLIALAAAFSSLSPARAASGVDVLTLQPGENNLYSGAVDAANGFAYFGTNTWPCRVMKVRLSDFTRVDSLSIPTSTGCNLLSVALVDSVRGF